MVATYEGDSSRLNADAIADAIATAIAAAICATLDLSEANTPPLIILSSTASGLST